MSVYLPIAELAIDLRVLIVLGLVVGFLSGLFGIGGGFIMIPAMIYLLGMPTAVVVGTSLFQTIFTTGNVTILQAATTQTVDVVLAMILLTGSVIGAQFGSTLSLKISAEKLRAMLALMVLAVCFKLALGLVLTPAEPYAIMVAE